MTTLSRIEEDLTHVWTPTKTEVIGDGLQSSRVVAWWRGEAKMKVVWWWTMMREEVLGIERERACLLINEQLGLD